MDKAAGAASVPLPDPATSSAALSPIPSLAVANKPAPGQTGPKGLAPRTSYSRVNAGTPGQSDAGASSQKAAPPDAQNFLPPKIAHSEVSMGQMTPRMTIQSMIKAAAAGAAEHAQISLEAARQLHQQSDAPAGQEKTAAPAGLELPDSLPTSHVEKLAAAIEFVATSQAEKVAEGPGPGTGPNALAVSTPTSSNNEIKPGSTGQATPAHVPPKNPPMQKTPGVSSDPGTGLADNTSMKHPEQPVKLSAAEIRKFAGLRRMSTSEAKDMALEKWKEKYDKKEKKAADASVDPRLVDYFLSVVKQAEDAINPAQISAGSAVAPETSGAGEPGGAPAGGQPQGPTGLIASNEAAINYTKGQAKAPVRADMGKLLTEPALSSAHDSTLNKALSETGAAGVKISSSLRTAAATALLSKLAEDAEKKDDDKKKKESMGGPGTYVAPPVGGVASTSM